MATGSEADGGPPRAVIIVAVALAVATIGVILAIAATREAPRNRSPSRASRRRRPKAPRAGR